MLIGYNKHCSLCKKRKAIYYHRLSGNRFCARCLRRHIIKTLHRAFGKYQLVEDRQPEMIYIFDTCFLPLSLYMYDVFLQAEKPFIERIKVVIGYAGTPIPQSFKTLLRDMGHRHNISVEASIVGVDCVSLPERIRVLRAQALRIARARSTEKYVYIVVPLPREYIIALSLASLTRIRHYFIADYLPKYLADDTTIIINPFYDTSAEDIIAYGVYRDETRENSLQSPTLISNNVVGFMKNLIQLVVVPRGGELLYTFPRIHKELSNTLLTNDRLYAKCTSCGGLEYKQYLNTHQGLCRVCVNFSGKLI